MSFTVLALCCLPLAGTTFAQEPAANQPPTADFTLDPDPPTAGVPTTLDAGASADPDGDELTYAWDLDDDGTVDATARTVEHAFPTAGDVVVVLTVDDGNGAQDELRATLTVNAAPTAAVDVTAPEQAQSGQTWTFDGSGSSDPDPGDTLEHAWDLGDDATATGPQVEHAYDAPGTYTVTLTVSDTAGASDQVSVDVTVTNAAPTAVIGLDPAAGIDTATEVSFDASGSSDVEEGSLTFAWDLGDTTTSTEAVVAHRYASPGIYTVTLTVTDEHGASGSATLDVEVVNAVPVILLDPPDPQGRPGEDILIDASGSFDPDGSAITFAWQAAGHEPGVDPSYVVSYADEDTFEVELTVTDADGGAATVTIPVRVDQDLVFRLAGSTRIETAAALSRRAFPAATHAVLARADDFPDALAASTLAAEIDGPILLTARDALSEPAAAELARLNVTHVYLAGGPAALGPQVEQALQEQRIAFTRLEGDDRFETAAAVAAELVRLGGPVDEAIVALGSHADPDKAWPDALVAGNLATAARAPVLLSSGSKLPAATRDALRGVVAGTRVWIAGGEAAVGSSVERVLKGDGWDVRRLAGPDRYATAVVVTDEARRRGAGTDPVVLASGRNFPDALAATGTAWKLGGVLLLVDPGDLLRSDATYAWLRHHREAVDTVVLAGGPAAVSDDVRRQVEARIEDGTQT
ncbi:MAG TPA: PKD domain-containing protein [Nitriliruptorales bacterium]